MKTIHYGQDYCQIRIGKNNYETSIRIGKAIDRMNKQIKDLKKRDYSTLRLKCMRCNSQNIIIGPKLKTKEC